MSALTKSRDTPERDAKRFSFPVAAAATIFQGSLVCLDNAQETFNVAVSATVTGTLICVGVAESTADNSAGVAGAIQVSVKRGCFRLANSTADPISSLDIGAACYVVDDQTVAKTSATATRPLAGMIRDVDSVGVWVEI